VPRRDEKVDGVIEANLRIRMPPDQDRAGLQVLRAT